MYGECGLFSSLCDRLVAVEVRTAGRHGKHLREPVEEPDRQKGDAYSHGGAGCRRENHHPLQAEARGDCHHHPHNWYVRKDINTCSILDTPVFVGSQLIKLISIHFLFRV